MRIGAVAYQPYVYNTNTVSAASLNRIGAIPNDATAGRTDFEDLTKEEENVNPLKRGQSANFMDILSSQMAMSRTRSAMMLKPAASDGGNAQASAVADTMRQDETTGKDAMQAVSDPAGKQGAEKQAADESLTIGDEKSGATGSSMNGAEDAVSYKMRYALDAYSTAMGMVA